ncbi:MAG TPA: DUF2845 domain-containing protein [Myxococcales bacterium]|nr:DUF2845 domain-containing protein [Myxococcales bacterium]
MKLAICLACFFSFAAHADETGCARISEGMSSLEVLRQCGQPPVVDFRQEEWHADDGTVLRVDTVERERGPRTIYDTVEDWVYDLGPARLVRTFTFRNGRVQLIETGGYGT